jgi:4-alpha-glucanotransferase
MKGLSALQRRAKTHGIQPRYLDMSGKAREASEDTLRRMLDLLGVSGEKEEPGLSPVFVQWDQKALKIPLPSSFKKFRASAHDWSARGQSEEILTVPPLPFGYHILRIETTRATYESLIISARRKIYSNPALAKAWGVFLPMYAVHCRQSWGAGSFSDWRKFCEWIGAQGGTVAATLPVVASFLEHPVCEPSPYSPASRLFWNEFYVDPTSAPELGNCASAKRLIGSAQFKRKLGSFRKSEFVHYSGELELRRRVLERLAAEFFAKPGNRLEQLQQLLRECPEVKDYAAFRATCDHLKTSWHTWPERLKSGDLRPSDYPGELYNFYLYTQFLAHEQMGQVLQTCRNRGVNFYLDLPLGVNPDGFDPWRYREFFAQGANAGAPPDAFFTKGQDWGFAPLHPLRMREQHYRYVIDYLRFQMRHTGLLRIDHVMGLHRLYWVPHGFPASEGAYVSYPAEELYAILSVESHLHQTMIVGENLGTVPPEVNNSMERHGLRKMYVVQYEQRPDEKVALPNPPRKVVASLNTHDMPMFAAHWKGLDIDDRADLGLIASADIKREHAQRRKTICALTAFLRRKGFLKTKRPDARAVLRACLEFLAASEAEIVLINLEDLWLETRPQNVPGTSTERPNWGRKTKLTLEQISGSSEVREVLNLIASLRKAS